LVKGTGKPTSICRNFMQPLRLGLLIFSLPTPPVDPFLFLLIPDFLFTSYFLYAFGSSKFLPFCGLFRFWKRFLTRKEENRRRQNGQRTIW